MEYCLVEGIPFVCKAMMGTSSLNDHTSFADKMTGALVIIAGREKI